MRGKAYDSRCYDLAALFLGDEPTLHTEEKIDELAALIQSTIEDFIVYGRSNTDAEIIGQRGTACKYGWSGTRCGMMEPEYIAQTAEAKTWEECRAWIVARTEEAKAQGMSHGRASHDPARNLLLVEAWKVRPDDEGEPRWQLGDST